MERIKGSIDRLSGLPDEILFHILSFLPTKLSVCTSVLAKRWRFMWTHVPNLQFLENNFRGGSETQPLDIIYRVAMLHQAVILNTFKLSKLKGCQSYQLDTLIIYLLAKRNLRNLYLDFRLEYGQDIACTLPRLLFTCKTLVDLKLVNCGVIPSRGELFLPSLKKLKLRYVQYEDDKSIPHLLSGCPVLEKLFIHDCFREGQKNLGCVIVSSPSIKALTVDLSSYNLEEMLIIDAPALVYLKMDHCHLKHVKSLRKTMTSLIEAEVTLNRDCHRCTGTDCTAHGPWVDFLSCLCHVRYLTISNHFDDTLVHLAGTGSMVKFVNLTELQLVLTVDWYNVVKFLEVADNLQVLIISIVETLPYIEPKRVPSCMLSRLRSVIMFYDNLHDCEDIFEMVRYILKNAHVLERMDIFDTSGSTNKENLDVLRKISLFERGSMSWQLYFNTDLIVGDVMNTRDFDVD